MTWNDDTMTMLCSKHGAVETLRPMPGTSPICPTCIEDGRERERANWEGLLPIRQQLDRIEKLLLEHSHGR